MAKAFDDRQNAIAIGQGIDYPLENDNAHPTAAHGSLGLGIKGPAVAIAGGDATFDIQIALFLRRIDRLTRQMHRHQYLRWRGHSKTFIGRLRTAPTRPTIV